MQLALSPSGVSDYESKFPASPCSEEEDLLHTPPSSPTQDVLFSAQDNVEPESAQDEAPDSPLGSLYDDDSASSDHGAGLIQPEVPPSPEVLHCPWQREESKMDADLFAALWEQKVLEYEAKANSQLSQWFAERLATATPLADKTYCCSLHCPEEVVATLASLYGDASVFFTKQQIKDAHVLAQAPPEIMTQDFDELNLMVSNFRTEHITAYNQAMAINAGK